MSIENFEIGVDVGGDATLVSLHNLHRWQQMSTQNPNCAVCKIIHISGTTRSIGVSFPKKLSRITLLLPLVLLVYQAARRLASQFPKDEWAVCCGVVEFLDMTNKASIRISRFY